MESLCRCRMSFLLLLLNAFLKVRAVYFKADSTISGAFQCSACSADGAPTCTSSTINFLGVEGLFSNAVGPSRVIWHDGHLLRCVGAFSQLLKCFSKLLGWLMVLLQLGVFLLLGLKFTLVLVECSFDWEKSATPLAFVFGSFNQIFHWLLNLLHLLIRCCKHGFELIIV